MQIGKREANERQNTEMGRLTEYTPEIAAVICSRIADGQSLRSICKDDDELPTSETIRVWLIEQSKFAAQYACARAEQAELFAQQIIEIADDGKNDTYLDVEGNVQVDTDNIQRSKLRVEARKWIASKLLPKKYGDQVKVEHSGEVQHGHYVLDEATRARLIERRRLALRNGSE